MNNLKIGTKNIIAPAIAILFLIVLGLFSSNALNSSENKIDTLVNEKFELYKQSSKLMSDINLYNSVLYKTFNYATGGYKQELIDEQLKVLESLGAEIDKESEAMSKLPFLDETEKKSYVELIKHVKAYKGAVKDAIDMISVDIGMATPMLSVTDETFIKINNELKKVNADISKDNKISHEEAVSSIDATLYALYILILIGLVASAIVTVVASRSITAPLYAFQNGLIEFFKYLNKEVGSVKQIENKSIDEIGLMAAVVNENISKTQSLLEQDDALITDVKRVVALVKNGQIKQQVNISSNNKSLDELRVIFNEMLDVMAANVCGDINKVQNALDSYKNKDFSHRIQNASGRTSQGLNGLADVINAMLVENLANATILARTSRELLGNTSTLNNSSNEAAARLEETAAALEEITSNIRANTENIGKMSGLARGVTTSAQTGEKLANETTRAMDEINIQVNSINEAIAVIDQIAFQTNILSLNAAVEAATAGEAGKGFAVVAGEVRNLASRSAEAAKEIKTLVENATKKANEGKNIANQMISGYGELNSNISQTINLISDIEHASKEQLSGIEQINDALTHLDQQTQQNASVASEASEIAQTTNAIALKMVESTNQNNFAGKDFKDKRSRAVDVNYKGAERRSIESIIKNSTR